MPESVWAILRLVCFRSSGELRQHENKQRDSRETKTRVARQSRGDYCTETLAKSHLILDISDDCRSTNYCENHEHQHEESRHMSMQGGSSGRESKNSCIHFTVNTND